MEWIYNSNTGVILQLPDPAAWAELHSGLGWHGPFKTHDDAVAYYNMGKSANPGWKAPIDVTDISGAVGNAASSAGAAVSKVASGWWSGNVEVVFLRVGEILLGLVLVGIGVAAVTGTGNAISKAAKVAVL